MPDRTELWRLSRIVIALALLGLLVLVSDSFLAPIRRKLGL